MGVIGRAFEWVRAVVLLAFWSARERWLRRCNAKLADELAWKTMVAEAEVVAQEATGLRPPMVLLRHSVDQCMAEIRDEVGSWPQARLDAYVEALQAAIDAPHLSGGQRLAAMSQYVAVQMVAIESAEVRLAGGGA